MLTNPKFKAISIKNIQQSRKKRKISDENIARSSKRDRFKTGNSFVNRYKFEDISIKNYTKTEYDNVEFIIVFNVFTLNPKVFFFNFKLSFLTLNTATLFFNFKPNFFTLNTAASFFNFKFNFFTLDTATSFFNFKINKKIRLQIFEFLKSEKHFVDSDKLKDTLIENFTATVLVNFKFIVITYTFTLNTTVFINRKVENETRSQISDRSKLKKTSIKNDEIENTLMKNAATTKLVQFDYCVNCANYYSFFSNLMCFKPIGLKKLYLLCIATQKDSCQTIKPCIKSILDTLQKVAQTYFNLSIFENLKALENQQKIFDKKLKN